VLNILAGMRDILKFHESVEALTSLGSATQVVANTTVVETAANQSIPLPDKRPPGAPPNPWES
jgi:hypothetical protein